MWGYTITSSAILGHVTLHNNKHHIRAYISELLRTFMSSSQLSCLPACISRQALDIRP